MNDASGSSTPRDGGAAEDPSITDTLRGWLRRLWKSKEDGGDTSVRDTLEELIEERVEAEGPIRKDELVLLANILDLRDLTVIDVMVPRVDIVAVERSATLAEIVEIVTREGHSRLPVYRGTLDNAIGMVHMKDLFAWWGREQEFKLRDAVHDVLFVAPSMHVLELLLEMRVKRIHMALVVDEYGGIDGLVTIEDLVEEIVGEIEDEHDVAAAPEFRRRTDGSLDAAARAGIEALEEIVGPFATKEERDEFLSLGGLVFALADRVPGRGEIVAHPAGLEFEILDSDPRRVKRLRIRDRRPVPATAAAETQG